jgi:putative hydrolase of the HAD superfamily
VISASAGDPRALIARLREYAQPLSPIPTRRRARLRRLPGIRAVLFDVYGTLLISASGDIGSGEAEARSRALGGALEALGIPAGRQTVEKAAGTLLKAISSTHERLRRQGKTHPEVDIREIFLELLGELRKQGLLAKEPDLMLCESLAVEYECRINPTWPMPGAEQTLRGLKDRALLLGLVSNAQFFTPLLFSAHFGQTPESMGFDPGLCAWSYMHLEAKPSVNLFLHSLRSLELRNIDAARVLYVGNDRINDIWPAALAGMKTALFAGDRRSFRPRWEDPRGREVREDVVLTHLNQLFAVLDQVSDSAGRGARPGAATGRQP